MLALGIDYLTGYTASTDPWDRSQVEWPPHPGRVFMALAASYFETYPPNGAADALADWEAEGEALRWLECQPPPALFVGEEDRRSVMDVYVPPNDIAANKRTVIPAFRSNRQPRTFPRAHLQDPTVYLIWPNGEPDDAHLPALQRLCEKMIRVGHSSSFVRMWVSDTNTLPPPSLEPAQAGETRAIAHRLRVVGPGCLDYLKDQFNGEACERFFELTGAIQSAKGRTQADLKATFEKEFGAPWKRNAAAPPSLRPVLTLTQEYVKTDTASMPPAETGWFDENLLVLSKIEGPILGLESTWQLITALRGAIEKQCEPTPEWVSGHQPAGQPSAKPHLALLPLGYVGAEHADGHLLGVALAFPKAVPAKDRGRALRNLLYNTNGTPADIRLTLGKAGVWTLRREERPSPPRALQPETWTAAPHGTTTWASASPVVLDRHPKSDPAKPAERSAWFEEVSAIIGDACERIGLPRPVEIDIDKTSWHLGAPRAKPGPDGFPLMPQRPGGPNRRQVHVWLRFEKPVCGPVILGAGRYRGYGFCRPV